MSSEGLIIDRRLTERYDKVKTGVGGVCRVLRRYVPGLRLLPAKGDRGGQRARGWALSAAAGEAGHLHLRPWWPCVGID